MLKGLLELQTCYFYNAFCGNIFLFLVLWHLYSKVTGQGSVSIVIDKNS